jgi:hypothetical protein
MRPQIARNCGSMSNILRTAREGAATRRSRVWTGGSTKVITGTPSEGVEVLGARKVGIEAGKAPMVAQHLHAIAVAGNETPRDAAALHDDRRGSQQSDW